MGKLTKQLAALIALLLGASFAHALVTPQPGLWGVDAENTGQPGRGFTIDVEYNVLVLTFYGYNADGTPQWYLSAGPLTDSGFSGSLDKYANGTTLGATYAPAQHIGNAGNVVLVFTDSMHGTITLPGEAAKPISRLIFASAPAPTLDAQALTLQLVGVWRLYTADQQTLLATYTLNSSPIHQGVNGYWINGGNSTPYPGFPAFLQGTGVQAGYNTTTSQDYFVDLTAENGFVWEFDFPMVVNRSISGCRYRYPVGSNDKGSCLSFIGFGI